jgi:hypothetical protein
MEFSFELCHGYICNPEKDIEPPKDEKTNVDRTNDSSSRPIKPVIVSEPINIPASNDTNSE